MKKKDLKAQENLDFKANHAPGQGYILGLSYNYHDAGAALIYKGEILGAVEEERFTRVKGDKSFPLNSINYLLSEFDVPLTRLEAVVFYESPYLKFNRLLTTLLLGRLKSLPLFTKALTTWFDSKLWVEKDIKNHLGKHQNIVLLHHHISHGASAFYPSPFQDAIVLTVDGVGEWSTTTIGYGNGAEYTISKEITFPNSLGLLYSAFTHYTGFKINSGEYKMMGLAPYGDPLYVDLIKKELITLNLDGSYSLNPKYFSFDKEERTYNKKFEELFGQPPRNPKEHIRKLDQDIAASIQIVLNEALLNICTFAKKEFNSKNLVLAGGVALNVVSVGFLERSGLFENIWVQPCSGDGGGALGSALYYHFQKTKLRTPNPDDMMAGSFLGPHEGTAEEIRKLLDDNKLVYTVFEPNALQKTISELLVGGQIVGICRGRMEYGPRALGSRSILADARIDDMQERLNLKTKFREGFRPFAPMILEEKVNDILSQPSTSPYMLKTFYLKSEHQLPSTNNKDIMLKVKEKRSPWPAITHIDYSCRVQTIDKKRNPFIHAVLSDFYDKTSSPVIVNTSFNVRGEPIVLTAFDALQGFKNMDIDALVLGDYLITKKDNPFFKADNSERRFLED